MLTTMVASMTDATLFLPFKAAWRQEKMLLLIFCGANIFIGQCGVIWPLLVASWQERFIRTLEQNLQSANLAVFAVSLLVGAGTIFVAELMEAPAEKKVELMGYKVFDACVAVALVIFQAMLTGDLVRASFVAQVPVASAPLATSGPTLSTVLSGIGLFQVLLWAASIVLAVHIFCLSRMHRYEAELAEMRQRQLARSSEAARNLHKTSDNEEL